MKFRRRTCQILLASIFVLIPVSWQAATNVSPTDNLSWGPNIGWLNWRGDVNDGANFRGYVSGYLWSGNVGWIFMGDGSPLNGIQYSNTVNNDIGVNLDRKSNANFVYLSGYGWGANIGWVNFNVEAQTGAANRPRIEKATGRLLGYAWSPNVGWLPLDSGPTAKVIVNLQNSARSWNRYE